MAELPRGTVTLLSAAVDDSGAPAEALRDRIAVHQRLVRAVVADAGGQEVDVRGAHVLAVFVRVRDAVDAAAAIQRANHDLGEANGASVALHTGEPLVAEGDYLGLDVHRVLKL